MSTCCWRTARPVLKSPLPLKAPSRLGLTEGQEVLVLLKAPWVGITLDHAVAQQADNQLTGRISHIERGPDRCEVIMALPDGQNLCATLSTAQTDGLQEGAQAIAYFNADRIILATLC